MERQVSHNTQSARARWRPGNAMAEHDRLPPPLRRFMIHADLPWDAQSVLRIWKKHRAKGLSPDAALIIISRAATATRARDTALVWGKDHPQA